MTISQRLRTCAKHTGLDAVIELMQEAADEIDALQARAQVQGEPVVDVRCEGCGYMTHHREHMGCVRAAKQHTHPAPSAAVTPEPVGYMNEGHIHELAMRRLPYGYVYPEAGAGASTAVYTHPSPRVPATGEPVLFIHPDTFAMNNAHVGAWKPGHELTGYIPLYTHPAPSVPADAVRNAKRYEWLRKADRWPCVFPDYFDPEPLAGSDLDAAIDAAMLAAK